MVTLLISKYLRYCHIDYCISLMIWYVVWYTFPDSQITAISMILFCPTFVTRISIQLEVVENNLDLQQTQINNITEEVEFHDSEITSLAENDITQNVRLDSVEDDVDEWDDKITALEVVNVDITDRLITVEEILLGEISYLKIDLNNIHFDVIYFNIFQSRGWPA